MECKWQGAAPNAETRRQIQTQTEIKIQIQIHIQIQIQIQIQKVKHQIPMSTLLWKVDDTVHLKTADMQ